MPEFNKVVVTGGAGLLGTHVMNRMSGSAQLTSIDMKVPVEENVGFGQYVEASITDYDAMKSTFAGQDAVIHLAAIPNPREAAAEEIFRNNVQGAWTVFQAAEDAGVKRVVVASSDSVFGLSYNPPDWPPQFLPVDESHPTRPSEVYSLSKKVTETIAESFAARRNMDVLAIRPCHILFPRGYPEIVSRGEDVENYHFWAWVDPEDVAQAFDQAVRADGIDRFEIFTIAAGEGLNTLPTLEVARERWGKLPEVRHPELYRMNPTASILDISKARERLGYEPTVNRADLLARCPA